MSKSNALLAEQINIVPAVLPSDFNGQANTGDRVSLAQYNRCTVVLIAAAGTADNDPTLTLLQADAASGGTTKAVDFEVIHRKQAATDLTAVGSYTREAQVAGNTYTNGTAGEEAQVWVIDITADQLDVANDFTFLEASVASVGAAKVSALFYLLSESRYTADGLPSPLV